jgi:oligogalacturonide lyase
LIGQRYTSEKEIVKDMKTGYSITRLTSGNSNNYHFYFTENSFISPDNKIVFLSDRGSKCKGHYNLFFMDLKTGEMLQLSDEPDSEEDDRCNRSSLH